MYQPYKLVKFNKACADIIKKHPSYLLSQLILINELDSVIVISSFEFLSGNGAKQRCAIVTSRKDCLPRLPFSVLTNIPGIE